MHVIDHSTLPRLYDTGRQRFAAASSRLGCAPFELWVEVLDADARAQLLPSDCIRVALVLTAGYGKLLVDGAPQRFRSPCSLMLPSGAECQVVNTGAEPMQLVLAFAPPAAPASGPSSRG
jgi:hypothetical protein